jgi:peptidoglycan/LPS O-acetylase OafA/YrhL
VVTNEQANLSRRYLNSLLLNPLGPWVDGVYWTLGIEISFYVIVVVTIGTLGARALTGLAITMILACASFWGLRTLDFLTGSSFQDSFRIIDDWPVRLIPITNGCHFGLGILLWAATVQGWSKFRITMALTAIGTGIVAIAALARYNETVGTSAAPILIAPAVWVFAVALIFLSTLRNNQISKAMGPWNSRIRTLGLMTYPLYLVHHQVGGAIMKYLQFMGAYSALLIASASMMITAYLVVLCERPIRRLLRRILEDRHIGPSNPPIP